MVYIAQWLELLTTTLLLGQAIAHPGHNVEEEALERRAFLKHSKKDLSHCSAKLKARGVEARALERRAAAVHGLRQEVKARKAKRQESYSTSMSTTMATSASSTSSASTSGMPSGNSTGPGGNSTGMGNSTGGAGQLASSISTFGAEVANSSHFSNLSVTPATSGVEEIIFGNTSCILSPEGEAGPFYVTGEFVRYDITETQAGVPLYVDGQFIDVASCEPIEDLYWDLWHANTTGVYGGVIGNGNGNSDDTSNLNNTFLRGLQPTDSDGVATFRSVFPGHYAGRATHIHVISHIGGSVLANGTYAGGNVTHVGQLFFDQDLIAEINDNLEPYSTNTIAIVENSEDRVFAEETLSDSDPVFDYVLLGDDVKDGLFAWISMGIDTSASYDAAVAAAYGADGGVLE